MVNAIVRLISHATAGQTEMSYLSLDVSAVPAATQITTTDANGAYVFYDVAIGNYTVEVTEPGYGTHSVDVAMTLDAVIGGGLTVDQVVSPSSLSDGSVIIVAIVGLAAAVLILVYAVRRRSAKAPPVMTETRTEAPAKVNAEEKKSEPQTIQNSPVKAKEKQPDAPVKKNNQGKGKGRQANSKGKKKGQQRKR